MRGEEQKIITHDGTVLPVPKKPNLFDLLPSPREAARGKGTGPSDSAVNASWLYSETGKAPR